ncbi:J domain-containing protein [Phytoactinopolyspora endophytica]|uniref:J domain-containing protein n=1 Tax=Phytoactinopolyspora endophytica TaxID=1642495 RepID=UPI00101B8F27|nr:DnaJ domain-containing protein [Phytoactinopolyspora endophytica]
MFTAARDVDELGGRYPHVVLGIPRGATSAQVRQAFRRQALSGGHPDNGGDDATFRALRRARDIMLDPRRFSEYDAAVGAGRSSGTRVPAAESSAGPPGDGHSTLSPTPRATSPAASPNASPTVPRAARRAGRDSGSAIPVLLLMIYGLSILVLPRILVAVFAMIGV